jgi:predicted secreted hydrolase
MLARLSSGLLAGALLPTTLLADTAPGAAAQVVPDRVLRFPRDRGSHPEFRTEWWYVTGWLEDARGAPLGFQVTFFRVRPEGPGLDNPSAFTPRQILLAHAALSDPERGRLLTDQRIARAGFGLAQASETDTGVWIDRWRLERSGSGYLTTIPGRDFAFELQLEPSVPPLLNGAGGFSRKGASVPAASYYYSEPHLAVRGSVTRSGRRETVTGEAWLDHEWSSDYLESGAVGWDWIGIDLEDGGALMAFRIRDRAGAARWAGGTLRGRDGSLRILEPGEVTFSPGRRWRSPRTGIDYPVAWSVRAGERHFTLEPLMDDQENDTRMSSGAIYWEGAVRAFEDGQSVGRGYLELTGYGEPLQLR